jgi:hypothetical protein
MTTQRELNRLLDAFFTEGTTELADRVIDAALDTIDHTPQRRAGGLPRRIQAMPLLTRLAAAAAIGVLAVGGALFLSRAPSDVGSQSPTPPVSASPSGPGPTPTPQSSPAGPMADGRQIHTVTELADGRFLIAGGYTDVEIALASAEVYDPSADAFSPTGSMADARGLHTATRLADGRVLIAGGGPASWVGNGLPYLASAELYDPATGTFNPTGAMSMPREDHTATLLEDGRVLIVGGNDEGSHTTPTAELYDPSTATFSPTGSLGTARGFHTATLLADGRVLIAGGDVAAWAANGPFLASAEIYDPTTGTFSPAGPLAEGRSHHAATLLPDGRVLVSGGVANGGSTSLASAELFDPATGTFSPTGAMTDGRVYHTATVLSDGRVLMTGGCPFGRVYANNPQFLKSAELYDPATGTFTPTGSMSYGRTWAEAMLLTGDRVLITGGVGDGSTISLDTAELYDPASGTFSPAGSGG